MNNYVTIYEEYRHKFFQLPKVFFTNEKYLNISNNAKIAWAILRDRSSLSRKNEWFDKDNGRIYFIYKNKELMDILNIKSETTLTKIKKELKDSNLIEEKRMGFNKPNKIYLIYPEITESDMYEIDNLENYEHEPIEKRNEEIDEKSYPQEQTQVGQGTTKNGVPKNEVHELQKMKSNNTDSSNTSKDLDTKDTRIKDFPSNQFIDLVNEKERLKLKEKYMKEAFFSNEDYVPEKLANMLKVFFVTPEEARMYYDVIMLAKRNAEKEIDQVIWLEHHPELEQKIISTFSRSFRKIEKERNIDNPKGYIFKSIYELLINEFKKPFEATNAPYLYNWLEENE